MVEYPAPTTSTYVLSAIALAGTALALYSQFTEPYSGLLMRFWGQTVLAFGLGTLAVSRILPSHLQSVGVLFGIPSVVIGGGLLLASHLL